VRAKLAVKNQSFKIPVRQKNHIRPTHNLGNKYLRKHQNLLQRVFNNNRTPSFAYQAESKFGQKRPKTFSQTNTI
jgi:hypothetical protein